MARIGLGGRRLERGASALEMAFVAPALIALIFLCIQGALFFYGRNVAIQAAREGVSQLRAVPDEATFAAIKGDALASVEGFAGEIGRESLIAPYATATYHDGAAYDRVSVTVSGGVITLLPGLHLHVSQTAEGPVEQFMGDS